jgi:hypothetical protein
LNTWPDGPRPMRTKVPRPKDTKMINTPSVDAESYLAEDTVTNTPKHGTTVQAGWGAASAYLKPKKDSQYATDFRFSEQTQLVRFLEDTPFAVYEQHWVDRTEGKRSFVCLGDECPLCTIAGDKPRPKFAFNIVVLSDGEPNVQILTAPPSFARQLQAANDDPRRGPLTKYYWAITRTGSGNTTQYTLDRVRSTDLAEDWELDAEPIEAFVKTAVSYDASTIYVSPREELLELARTLVS